MSQIVRIKCLVLDHDDTVVKSTPEINFPAFLKSLAVLRPGVEIDFEKFTEWTFQPGFYPMCTDILKYTEEEMEFQKQCWLEAEARIIPDVYEGLPEILNRYVKNGGHICVASHSQKNTILRDYKAAKLPIPEHIYDCDLPEDKRKPSPYALQNIMERYQLSPEEILMVDDLKPGFDMANECKVPFACAGWSDNQIPVIREFMQQYSTYYLKTTEELEQLLYK